MNRIEPARLKGIGMTSERTRRRMVERLQEKGIDDDRVLAVMAAVPRHIFVDEALSHRVYDDVSLPIGYGQTLSNSYTVARMTSLLLAHAPETGLRRVLEIGTGSGYQTAVLAHLVQELYTVERIAPLQKQARQRLRALKLHGVRSHLSDGHWGWPEHAPFDAILCTAAPETIPRALIEQLNSDGGVLVIPVGDAASQQLVRVSRWGDEVAEEVVDAAMFVPLVSESDTDHASEPLAATVSDSVLPPMQDQWNHQREKT